MSQHKAASFAHQGQPAKVIDVPTVAPTEGQVLVKVYAWATNPVDYTMRDTGIFVKSWPLITGSDVAGEIVEVGSGVTSHKKGDRVLVATTYLLMGEPREAGFQELVIAPTIAVTKIPDSLAFEQAVVVGLSTATSATGLYEKGQLGLDLPSANPKPNGKKLLIWGGGSSVAASTIQLAKASGYEVIATSSSKHFDYVKSLGASKVYDYNSPSIVGDLTEELQNGQCVGAFDAIAKLGTSLAIATVLAQLGGGKIVSVRPVNDDILPATVEATTIFAVTILAPGNPIAQAVFQDFLPQALASGQFVPQPKAQVVGSGLDAIQGALDKHMAGVSAKKLVITA